MLRQIIQELKSIKCTPKKLKEFSLLVGGIFSALGLLEIWFFSLWAIIVGVALLIGGIVRPEMLKQLYLIWMGIAVVLGFFVSRILLVILYIFVIVPIGLFLRAIKHKLIKLKPNQEMKSYWSTRNKTEIGTITKPY